ncbi:protein suppressor of variegation 3-7-like [Drosophila serrata]|uniref:protein suppressor of variegation 3-7-like n=1 Tax=Drosophila serrata TaxID=7274 RepID=UPI000A1D0CC1|nr:protein suppressor of variegation 3-7-like [Drosophila serrata]XP_020811464.1 protein suppressor of variegation 3-7-like [Drosophila serrata]
MPKVKKAVDDEQSNTNSGTVEVKKATMKGKVTMWKSRFPWMSYKKSEIRDDYAWCKLCKVSVYLANSKCAKEHQRTAQHIHLGKRNGGQSQAAAALASDEDKQKTDMAELVAKYKWLEPDSNDENLFHCRVCNTRISIKECFLRQHDSSRKHAEGQERQESGSNKNTDADVSVSTAEPPGKRSRRSMEVRRIVHDALRDSVGKRYEERSQLDLANEMISTSFDIVTRLRTLQQKGAMGQCNCMAQAPEPLKVTPANTQPSEPRHAIDIFFESIAPTMKSLPADLAAEGKAKIMQIACELDVRAMHKKNPKLQSSPVPLTPVAEPSATVQGAAGDVDFNSNIISINEDDQIMENNNNDLESSLNANPSYLAESNRRVWATTQFQSTEYFYDPVDKN